MELKLGSPRKPSAARRFRDCLAIVGLLLAGPAGATADLTADYELLQEWRYSERAVHIPASGMILSAGSASWTLESGTLSWAEPLPNGRVTGIVFDGQGTFRFAVPDAYELEQLRRFSEMDDLEELELAFDRLILRTGDVSSYLDLPAPANPGYEANRLAKDRHEHWLERRRFDADARVLMVQANSKDNYLRVEVDTDEFGWLTWEREPARDEPVQLYLYKQHYLETWVSLRREFEAREVDLRHAYDLRHVDLHADLRKPGKHTRQGMSRQHPRAGHFVAELEIEGRAETTSVLHFALDSFAQVKAVRRDDRDLHYLRNRIGEASRDILDEIEDDDLFVFLDQPLARGEILRLVVEYEMEVLNYLPGRSWYPGLAEGALKDLHTANLTLVLPKKIEARAMGTASEAVIDPEDKSVSQTWTIDQPVRMLTTVLAEKSIDEELVVENRPKIRVFGSRTRSSKGRFREIAVDISDSHAYFESLFGKTVDMPEIQVARIVSSHGQAFLGFLQLSEATFWVQSQGPSQLFRAHEVAHHWWGQSVGWDSYRDQWLSEALAEYSAMMFVEATLDDGPKLFAEMLEVYRNEQLGSLKTAMSRFSRAWMIHLNDVARKRIGPIGIGYRASTWDAVTGYGSQVYQRGALVLHMLRGLMRHASGSDEAFLAALADFAATERGRNVSTSAFRAAMERHYPGDLSWFFEQWIFGTSIPDYRWSYEIERGEEQQIRAIVNVRQEDFLAGSRMPIPIRFEYSDGSTEEVWCVVDEAAKQCSFEIEREPRDVVFAPDSAVLATIKQDRQ